MLASNKKINLFLFKLFCKSFINNFAWRLLIKVFFLECQLAHVKWSVDVIKEENVETSSKHRVDLENVDVSFHIFNERIFS